MPEDIQPAEAVALAFARAISRQSVADLAGLMTEDHVFIDALGNRVSGKSKMMAAWEAYFRMVPDYRVTVEESFPHGPVVLLFGTAQGTYAAQGVLLPENRWSTPAAWRVVVRGPLVAEWRVYADNQPIRQIMARHRG